MEYQLWRLLTLMTTFTYELIDILRFLLCCCEHAVLHQSSVKSTVHPLKAVSIPHTFEILVRLKNEASWIIHTNPHRMPPGCYRFIDPVSCCHLIHQASCINDFLVLLNRNEIWMCPFLIKKLEVSFVLLVKGHFPVVPLAPCCHHVLPPRLQNPHHFIDVFFLVRHVLTRLACPHHIEAIVGKFHLKRIHDSEFRIWYPLFFGELCGTLDLVWTKSDSCNISIWP
mmetsp:Transcript_37768/g.69783  ORF Transcript_37768/g.69783 Transcript_37768/m.69783 type:complete len:226 (-) Transcript_37768:666-1343(-)